MSDNFLGEIRTFSFSWPPAGWAVCNGAVMPIKQNQALFSLLGPQFPGGVTNVSFALPDLQGRGILGGGYSYTSGIMVQTGTVAGTETVALTATQLPIHTHSLRASSAAGTAVGPAGNILAQAVPKTAGYPITPYAPASANMTAMNPASVVTAGAGAPHENMQPFTVVNYCIAISGNYPMRP
jgi:microcystin-dependent protein